MTQDLKGHAAESHLHASPVLRGSEALGAIPFRSLWRQEQSRQTNERTIDSSQLAVSDPLDVDFIGHLSDPRIAELEGEVAWLREQMLSQEQEHQRKLQEVIAASRVEALAQLQRDDAARTQALLLAVKEALAQQSLHFQRMENEAVRIASTALQPVFGEAVELSKLVLATIEHQVQSLQERSVLELRVSAADELDLTAINASLHAKAQSKALVVADTSLPKGAVHIGMRLGHVRLDLGEYANAVRQTLQDIADAQVNSSESGGGPK